MPTVATLTAPYGARLLPVLSGTDDVCAVCGTGLLDRPLCRQCQRAALLLSHPAQAVAAVGLAVKGGQLARELAAYKRPGQPRLRAQLAAVLWRWLRGHEQCLATAAGARRFDLVTVVPSLRGRGGDPLAQLAGRLIGPTRDRFHPVLTAGRDGPPFSDQRFRCRQLGDRPAVLLIDDTWTTGAHAQSAASALRLAGASTVAVLALGRHFHPDPPAPYTAAARAYLARATAQGWSWETCGYCRPAALRAAG